MWLVLICVVLLAGGWLIGRLPVLARAASAFALAAIVPGIWVIYRFSYERKHGYPPETWFAATVLYTIAGIALIGLGVFVRWFFSQRWD